MFLSKIVDDTPEPIRRALSGLMSPLRETAELRENISQIARHLNYGLQFAGRSVHFVGCGFDFGDFCKPMIEKARYQGAAVSFSCIWIRVSPSFFPDDENTTDIYRAFHGTRKETEPQVSEVIVALSIASDSSMVHTLLRETVKRFPTASIKLVTGVVSDRVVDLLDRHWSNVSLSAIEYGPDLRSMRDPFWNVVRMLDDEARPLVSLHPDMQLVAFSENAIAKPAPDRPSTRSPGMRPGSRGEDET